MNFFRNRHLDRLLCMLLHVIVILILGAYFYAKHIVLISYQQTVGHRDTQKVKASAQKTV